MCAAARGSSENGQRHSKQFLPSCCCSSTFFRARHIFELTRTASGALHATRTGFHRGAVARISRVETRGGSIANVACARRDKRGRAEATRRRSHEERLSDLVMSNNERVDRAHVRANRAFEGELVFEGEWVPPTPFNGIAFLASGVVLRHLHRRTQARGAPRPSSIARPKKTNEARPSEPRRDAPRPTRPRLTKSTRPRPPLLAENGTQNANRRGRGDTERRPWWRRRRLGNRAPDDEYENENENNRPRPRWTAAENVVGDDPRGRFVAGIPHSREEGSNDAREGVEGTHGGTRVVRRSESEDDLMRLAATSREAHLRHVAAAMAARDGGDGARGVDVPRTEVPPRDVGDVASVSPASSAPLAEVESLPEPARSQIEFFRRLSVESARPEEDGRGTIATEGGGAEGGAEVSQLCAEGGADAQLCATVPPARGTDPDPPEQRTCRFCLGGEDEGAAGDDALIAPCRCRGTQGWVHHGCLREWQRVSVSSTGRVERRCRVCHSAFRTPRPPIKDVIKEWCVSFSLTCISAINLAIRMTSLRVQSNPTGSIQPPPTGSSATAERGGRCSATPSWRKRAWSTSAPRTNSSGCSSPPS